jgi:hypothetical protein
MRNCGPPDHEPWVPRRQPVARRCYGACGRIGAARQTLRLASHCRTAGGRSRCRVGLPVAGEVTGGRGSRRELLRAFVKSAGLALILVLPYFALNASYVYHYIILAFVTQGEFWTPPGSTWDRLVFYSVGTAYRTGLYHTLWLGLLFLAASSFLTWRRRDTGQLLRLLLYAWVVATSYLVPTISPMKSYFLGGMFYGTFLLFTLTVMSLFFESLEETIRVGGYRTVLVKYAALIMLLLVALTSLDRFSLATQFDSAGSADVRAVSSRIIAGISSAAENKHHQILVYVPSPAPITSYYIRLAETMRNVDTIVQYGYYVRSLEEQEANANKADFVVLSDHAGMFYPGSQMTPQLLNYLRADAAFRQIVLFTHPDGKGTYLFERVSDPTQ